ncbi:MAG: DUF58 domain-containing protein [Candidatus Omnitrophica bacterium]|nr:DUF58 domain-containing protein [Candidatus Omnitrophota bacterium]
MIPKEILNQVKHIEIRATRLVNDLFGGEYESVFKGRGMEFSEVREYVPGDDIRTIDWNVTARSQHPFVKKFTEERELTVVFVVDGSKSLQFGSTEKTKATVAAELAGLLAFSAIKNKDKVGLLIATDHVEKYVPPKKGRSHVLRVLREILYFKPSAKKTNLKAALEHLYRILTRSAVIFVISDFMDSGYEKALKLLDQKHDLIAIQITDEREQTLPDCGLMELQDAETGEMALVNTSDQKFRESYLKTSQRRQEQLDLLFKLTGIDAIKIVAGTSYINPLVKFFLARERRLRR